MKRVIGQLSPDMRMMVTVRAQMSRGLTVAVSPVGIPIKRELARKFSDKKRFVSE
jgi:hypothetical protein